MKNINIDDVNNIKFYKITLHEDRSEGFIKTAMKFVPLERHSLEAIAKNQYNSQEKKIREEPPILIKKNKKKTR